MKGLLGMDIIRLALERTKSSKEALNFIINTIETYGQGGNASYEHKMLYSNSFMIADPNEAWVLETAGKYWVAKKVEDFYTISNALTISDD
jgi:dipeptidase